MLTNMPTNASRSRCPRPAIGVPTVTSVVAASRDRSAASVACTTMNGVTPCSRATADTRPAMAAGIANPTCAPRSEATRGRGRSVGSSTTSGTPASASSQ
ncbi:Uncharacterised protein [Mycobacteroides abscessus subsp. abscessus]|nr:Uncharacterised protein [Mycobacteroides abscessus subsp. abscessus]